MLPVDHDFGGSMGRKEKYVKAYEDGKNEMRRKFKLLLGFCILVIFVIFNVTHTNGGDFGNIGGKFNNEDDIEGGDDSDFTISNLKGSSIHSNCLKITEKFSSNSLLSGKAVKNEYLAWLAHQMKTYWTKMCQQDPFYVEKFADHIEFERNYIDKVMLKTLPSYSTASSLFPKKKGIVITTANKAEQLQFVQRTIKLVLDKIKEPLPIEVWTNDGAPIKGFKPCDDPNLDVTCRDFLDPSDLGFKRDFLPADRYEWCIYAAVFSGFEQVIVLDTDIAPLDDISHLFNMPEYKKTGQLFYGDWWGMGSANWGEAAHMDSPLWEFTHVNTYHTNEQETSILVLNKQKIWQELNLVLHLARFEQLMKEGGAHRGYTRVIMGDKDVWRLAWMYLHKDFYMARAFMLGEYNDDKGGFCRISFGHIGEKVDQVLFIHHPKVMDLPYYSKLTHALIEQRCAGQMRYDEADCRPCVNPNTVSYDYKTGKVGGGLKSEWVLHKCLWNCNVNSVKFATYVEFDKKFQTQDFLNFKN